MLRTDKVSIADYNNDGRVDLKDYAVWAKDYGKIGNSQSDLARVDEKGIVHVGTGGDGRVDYTDMKAFFKEMSKDVARRAPKGATPKGLSYLAGLYHRELMEKATGKR